MHRVFSSTGCAFASSARTVILTKYCSMVPPRDQYNRTNDLVQLLDNLAGALLYFAHKGGGMRVQIGFMLLCGGRSSRMGCDKARIEVAGETLLARAARAGDGFEERLLSSGDSACTWPGFQTVVDRLSGVGPMGGLEACLAQTVSDALVVMPCDMPGYDRSLIRFLCENFLEDDDALTLEDSTGHMHPLCAVYAKTCRPAIAQCMIEGNYKLGVMLGMVRHRKIQLPLGMDDHVFANLNTSDDLARWRKGL
ncbi:MAG: molybdenum cofactor guanylyltransferase [Clostridia bacterium]